jgi:hypothetical protein
MGNVQRTLTRKQSQCVGGVGHPQDLSCVADNFVFANLNPACDLNPADNGAWRVV